MNEWLVGRASPRAGFAPKAMAYTNRLAGTLAPPFIGSCDVRGTCIATMNLYPAILFSYDFAFSVRSLRSLAAKSIRFMERWMEEMFRSLRLLASAATNRSFFSVDTAAVP